jgi:hypothetical protein
LATPAQAPPGSWSAGIIWSQIAVSVAISDSESGRGTDFLAQAAVVEAANAPSRNLRRSSDLVFAIISDLK